MIDRKYRSKDLIGRKCRPVCPISDISGNLIYDDTVCTIEAVVRGHGFTIMTDTCPHCGQRVYVTGMDRQDLILIEGDTYEDRAMVLLKACLSLLNKQKDNHFVLNLLEETVAYDGTDCDGYCLSGYIEDYLQEKGELTHDE